MRSFRFQHWMTHLALAAALLLAVVPTLGRWAQPAGSTAADHTAMMMAAGSGGMAMMHHAMPAPEQARVPTPMNGKHDGGGHAGDCAYCPLLASLLPMLLVLAILLPLLQRIRLRGAATLTRRVPPLRLGLGARGPPILL